MKKCPKCGNKKFIVTAHVTQNWLVDENEIFLECLEECVEITHKPGNEDMWKCIICDYMGIGKEFEEEKQHES